MTLDELRACMKFDRANEIAAAEITQQQQTFTRDQAAVKAEQAEVDKTTEENRARLAVLASERNAMTAVVSDLESRALSAKTDEEKAAHEADRLKLIERNRMHQQNVESFNAVQQAQRIRVDAVNARIDAINQRNKTVNDRVEPLQKQVAAWKEQCGNRRFREEDEIAIKKEMAAGK